MINYFFKTNKSEEVDIRENFTFILGRGELLAPVEAAISQMKEGEKRHVSFTIADFEVSGDVELLTITNTMAKATHNILPQIEVNQIASQKKELGNALIKTRNFLEAISMFEEVVAVFKSTGGDWQPGPETDLRNQLELSSQLNLAFCHLQLAGHEPRAIESSTDALLIDKTNVKALYRRATAYKRFGELAKAKRDCITAAKLEPNNMEIRRLLAEVKALQATHDAEEMKTYSKLYKPVATASAWLDISIDAKPVGRLVFGLFSNDVPITCNSFLLHCKQGNYIGCGFHKLVKGFVVQGGDFEFEDGSGGFGLLGAGEKSRYFADESFKTGSHNRRGVLSMANSGPNTNTSQFFVTLAATEKLDGKHVIFGEMKEGLEVLDAIEAVPSDDYRRPTLRIEVTGSGCN